MKRSLLTSFIIFLYLGFCSTVIGQIDNDRYSNKEYGISFSIPKGMNKYTPENPGPLRSLFSEGTLLKLVNLDFKDENIDISCSGDNKVSEADLKEFKLRLDANPNMNIPGYQRISVSFTKIGKQKDKIAVEHVYKMRGNVLGKLRQVTFSHRDRGFIFTCGTAFERFDEANQQFFDVLFNSMEFY